jgi:hypothetical protein
MPEDTDSGEVTKEEVVGSMRVLLAKFSTCTRTDRKAASNRPESNASYVERKGREQHKRIYMCEQIRIKIYQTTSRSQRQKEFLIHKHAHFLGTSGPANFLQLNTSIFHPSTNAPPCISYLCGSV